MKIKNYPIQPGKSDIEVTLSDFGFGNFESPNNVVSIQATVQLCYESVFCQITESHKAIDLKKIEGIGLLEFTRNDIADPFYSTKNLQSPGGAFESVSFLQNLSLFGGAKALYEKNSDIKHRIIMALGDKYPLISLEELTKIVDSDTDVLASLRPKPYKVGTENYTTGQDQIRDFFEYLLFQEFSQFFFPSLFIE